MPRAINEFLLSHGFRLSDNPCVSPDFCLDWPALRDALARGEPLHVWPKSSFQTADGHWSLAEDRTTGDCAWLLEPGGSGAGHGLSDGIASAGGAQAFPASWENLLRLKNRVQEHDSGATIFPAAEGTLGRGTIGVGARFTTLHWPAVEWAMSALDFSMTANQNSIPRELVYDTDAMLEGRLALVPFAFLGTGVPEGHQGQSVEGMSHGAVISKLKTGFHRRRIPWSFNADHQPIGGAFDAREDALVRGCLLASYITFDLLPELSAPQAGAAAVDAATAEKAWARVREAGVAPSRGEFDRLLRQVGPAMLKMQRRDRKYREARAAAFTAEVGRRYLRELSIDELPGITPPATTAVMLALAEALGMPVDRVAPAFGFQKNLPYPDEAALRRLVEAQWAVCQRFGAGLGFHSGSGKSAANYRVLGEVTGGRLEIKTSGRYTYEMGVALSGSTDPADQALWSDWHRFTLELAVAGAFSPDGPEAAAARSFIADTLTRCGKPAEVFGSPGECRAALAALPPSADHVFFFEYNFLFVLAAGGRPEKAALGDHTAAGYAQRGRFYAISPEARLRYARGVARYLVFLAENTGLVPEPRCAAARRLLERYRTLEEMMGDISR